MLNSRAENGHKDRDVVAATEQLGSAKMKIVYSFVVRDDDSGQYIPAPRKGTLGAIKAAKGRPVDGSGQDVPDTMVDAAGLYLGAESASSVISDNSEGSRSR